LVDLEALGNRLRFVITSLQMFVGLTSTMYVSAKSFIQEKYGGSD
jgi:hypothetical protein